MPNFRPLSETKFINDANLVSYWKLDETSGNATDSKGSNTLTNSSVSYSSAKFGNGAVTASGGRLSIADASQTGLDFSTAFTFSWWQKKADSVATDVIGKWGSSSQRAYYIQNWSDQKIYISLSDNGTNNPYWVSTSGFSSATGYNHWMVSYNAGTIIVTFNGQVVSGSWVGTAPTSIFNSSSDFVLGYFNNSALGFDIDDMACFNRAFTASEGNELYQGMTYGEYLGAGSATTKLLLHLNGNSTDSSGNGNNGTDTNITYSQANGKFGQGAGFNGSSSKIDLPNLGVSGSSARTISMWIYPTAVSPSNYFYSSGVDGTATIFCLNVTSTNRIYLYGSSNDFASSNNSITLNTWQHITVTYDGGVSSTSTVHFYVNGVVSPTVSIAGNIGSTYNTTNSNYALGLYKVGNSNFFNGSIDEVIIENVAWSAEEVKKYYTFSKGRFGIL